MKIKEITRWFSFLLIMTAITGCLQLTKNVTASSPVASALPGNSISSTKALTPNLTRLPTGTSIYSFTPTAFPSLSVEDARKKLLDLLATNGNCRLPCLWGINPGVSDYQEARNILMPLNSVAEIAHFDSSSPVDDISPLYVEEELRLNTHVAYLYDKHGIVSFVGFQVLEEQVPVDSNGNWINKTPIFDSPTFIKRTEYYSLSHLLSEQGIPASVMIASSGPSINRDGSILTYLVIIYPEQGIWAQYTTLINEKEIKNEIISCPKNAHIQMELYPPGNPDSFFTLLDQTDWGITKNSYKSLEEATSISVEEFYETFRNPTENCLTTSVSIWPTPDR